MADEPVGPPSEVQGAELAARRFEALICTDLDAIIGVDQAGRITLFNPGAQRIFGHAPEEVHGKNVSVLMPSPYRDEHDSYLAAYRDTGVRKAIGTIREVHGRRRNGEVFPIELFVTETKVGDDVAFMAILRDVSDREAAREAVRISEARFDAFVEHAPAVAFIKDEQGRYLYVNRAFETFFRCQRSDIEGKTDYELRPPEIARALRANDHEVLSRGRTLETQEVTDDPSGRLAEWLTLKFPLEIRPGRMVLGGMAVNVTQQRAAERTLRMQFRMAREMTDAQSKVECVPKLLRVIAEGLAFQLAEFWEIDEAGDTLVFSACWHGTLIDGARHAAQHGQLRFSRGVGIPGRVWELGCPVMAPDLIHDRYVESVQQAARVILSGCCAFPVQADGRVLGVILLLRQTRLEPDEDHLPGAIEALGVQIGGYLERERAQRRIAELNREAEQRGRLAEIGAIAARIVHDLGNPIAGIRLQAQLLARAAERSAAPEFAKPVEQILAATGLLARLVGDLKDFARAQRLICREVDIAGFLREIELFWTPVATDRGVRLVVEPGSIGPLRIDADKMRRVIDNLVKNAFEAVQASGQVLVRAHMFDGKPRITVADNGPGMPLGFNTLRLFESTKPSGAGLGLAIARELVSAHGGQLIFEPAVPHGSCFHAELPASAMVIHAHP